MENCGNLLAVEIAGCARQAALAAVPAAKRHVASAADFRCAEMCACSACAGDYEDPDRTAWPEDDEERDEGERGQAPEPSAEEFPAEER